MSISTRGSASNGHSTTGPSVFDKFKMGAMMGASVGMIIGLIFGTTNIVRNGPGPNGFTRTLGQYMLGSAATFGVFMGVGTTIRSEHDLSTSPSSAQHAIMRARAVQVLPRQYRSYYVTSRK